MTLFSICINLIESFLYTLFIGNYFKLRSIKLYITLFTFLQFALLSFAIVINNSGLWLTLAIVSLMVCSLIIWTRKIEFDYFYIVILYNILLSVIAYSTFFFTSNFMVFIHNSDPILIYYTLCIISKTIQLACTIFLVKKQINFSTSFTLNNWKSIILVDILTLSAFAILICALIENRNNIFILQILLIIMFFVSVGYRQTIKKIDNLNKERIEFIKLEELTKYNQKTLEMITHLKNDIAAADHRMVYMLYQIEQYAKTNKIDKLSFSIGKYRDLMSKNKMVTNTNNPIFDCLYSLKINDLILQGKNIENMIFITKKDVYNDMSYINSLTGLIDLFSECNSLMISMNETGDFINIKIIYRDGQINERDVAQYCESNFNSKASYNLTNHQIKGLRLSINLEELYAK